MRWWLTVATGLFLAAQASGGPVMNPHLEAMVEAERRFAAETKKVGVREGFLTYLAEDAVVFRPGPVNAHEWYGERPPSSGWLNWTPAFAEIAASGDFGYTTGPWSYRRDPEAEQADAHGHYVSVWRRTEENGWRALVDAGVDHGPVVVRNVKVVAVSHGTDRRGAGQERDWLREVLRADRDLADKAQSMGLQAALLEAAVKDIRVYREGDLPEKGFDGVRKRVAVGPGAVDWEPWDGRVAPSGDLACTWGVGTLTGRDGDLQFTYLRIWRWTEGSWRVVLDLRNRH